MARCHAMRLLSGSITGPPLLYRSPGYAEHAKSQVTGRQGNILNAFPQICTPKFLLCFLGNRAPSDQLPFVFARRQLLGHVSKRANQNPVAVNPRHLYNESYVATVASLPQAEVLQCDQGSTVWAVLLRADRNCSHLLLDRESLRRCPFGCCFALGAAFCGALGCSSLPRWLVWGRVPALLY